MFDRESHKSAEELAREQQRFDIHVMAFSDRSLRVSQALQQAFAIDAETALELLSATPVVVKRAATPEVADALLDVLGRLGAQVVILPSPMPPHGELAVSDPPAAAARERGAAGWGGLDVRLPAHVPLSLAPASADAFARDAVEPAPSVDDATGCHDGDLEFDLGGAPAADQAPATQTSAELESDPEPLRALPPASVSARPIGAQGGAVRSVRPSLEAALSLAPPSVARKVLPKASSDLGLGSVPPLPRLPQFPVARELSLPPPPPPSGHPARPAHARASLRAHSLSPGPSAPQLGTVSMRPVAQFAPQEQALSRPSLRPLPPPMPGVPAARASVSLIPPPRPAPKRKQGGTPRMLDLPAGAAPRLDLAARPKRQSPVLSRTRARSRRPAADAPAPLVLPRARAVDLDLALPIDDLRPAAQPQPAAGGRPTRSRAMAVLEVIAAVAVLYLGLYFDDSILHGAASWLSVGVHGFAIYALGAGLVGGATVNRWQPLWLLLCLGLSAGVNRAMQPALPYELSAGERTMSTGTLRLQEDAVSHDFRLISMYVIAADVPRLLADPLTVRELWLRSPEEGGDGADLELFFDLGSEGAVRDLQLRDARALRGRRLPVISGASGADIRSRVRLPGAAEPVPVREGTLVIEEVLALDPGNPAQGFRVRAGLQLSLAAEDAERHMGGELNARLVWR